MYVKICGVTHPDDATFAVNQGADFIGTIFSPYSKRKVTLPLAKEIAHSTRQRGGKPVAVFTAESAEKIISICDEADIHHVQLHGRYSLDVLQSLNEKFFLIYAIPVDGKNIFIPTFVTPLFDNATPGKGISFNWNEFTPITNRQWFLAGGLTPTNVTAAIDLLNPNGVDVATGVEFLNSTRKDPEKVKAFIQNAKTKKETL